MENLQADGYILFLQINILHLIQRSVKQTMLILSLVPVFKFFVTFLLRFHQLNTPWNIDNTLKVFYPSSTANFRSYAFRTTCWGLMCSLNPPYVMYEGTPPFFAPDRTSKQACLVLDLCVCHIHYRTMTFPVVPILPILHLMNFEEDVYWKYSGRNACNMFLRTF